MRLTVVKYRQHIGRHFNNIWRNAKKIKLSCDEGLRQKLETRGIQVQDANEFIRDLEAPQKSVTVVGKHPPPLPTGKDHPLWHDELCYKYLGGRNIIGGVPQAKVLTKSVEIKPGLPDRIYSLEDLEKIPNEDYLVQRLIRSSQLFDATQEKLPKVIDITRLGLQQPREWGIPESKKNMLLMEGMQHLCQCVLSKYLSDSPRSSIRRPSVGAAVVRHGNRVKLKPSLMSLLTSAQPLAPFANSSEVELTESVELPDLYPTNCVLHFIKDNIYDWRDEFVVTHQGPPMFHPHSIYLTHNHHLKFYTKEEDFISRAIVSAFTVATAQARRMYGESVDVLPQPVTVQCVQTEGKYFHFLCYQLNTLELSTDDGVKNIYWSAPWEALFDDCKMDEGRPVLRGYNSNIIRKFLALYLNGLISSSFPSQESSSSVT